MFKSYSPLSVYPEPLYCIIKTGLRSNWDSLSPTLKPVSKALSTIKLALTLFATSIIKKILKENPPKKVKSLSKVSLPSINYFPKKNLFSLKLLSGTTLLFTLLNPVLCKSTNSFPSTLKMKLIVGERLLEPNGGFLTLKNQELTTKTKTIWLGQLTFCEIEKISTSKNVFTANFQQIKARILKKGSFHPS